MTTREELLKERQAFSFRKLIAVREFPIIAFIVVLSIIFSVVIDGFFSFKNLENIMRQVAVIGIMSIGMTLAIVSAGIDLSVGSMLAFSVSIGGQGILVGWPMGIVYAAILLLGLLLGFINGFLITRIKVPALIITLGTMNIYRGLTMIITKGNWITPIPRSYSFIGQGNMPLVVLLTVLVVFVIITKYMRFGRNLFAIGGNEEAAHYSGVPIRRYRVIVFTISGFLCALAGLIFVGRSAMIQPDAAVNYEMDAIAAVVIGGTSIFGGTGSVLGTLFGSILMALILAGLTMLSVDPYWQGLVTGILIIIAITLDSVRQMRSKE